MPFSPGCSAASFLLPRGCRRAKPLVIDIAGESSLFAILLFGAPTAIVSPHLPDRISPSALLFDKA